MGLRRQVAIVVLYASKRAGTGALKDRRAGRQYSTRLVRGSPGLAGPDGRGRSSNSQPLQDMSHCSTVWKEEVDRRMVALWPRLGWGIGTGLEVSEGW